jgi:hypothetical protein
MLTLFKIHQILSIMCFIRKLDKLFIAYIYQAISPNWYGMITFVIPRVILECGTAVSPAAYDTVRPSYHMS